MFDWERDHADREAKQARCGRLAAQRAKRLSTEELNQILAELHANDTTFGPLGYALIDLPKGSYDYNDIGAISQAIGGVYTEKSGREWIPEPDTSWRPHFIPARVGTMRVGEPLGRWSDPESLQETAQNHGPPIKVPILSVFGALCRSATRDEVIEPAMADIRRQVRAAQERGFSTGFTRRMAWVYAILCVLSVIGDAVARTTRRWEPAIRLIRLIMGYMDDPPPRNGA